MDTLELPVVGHGPSRHGARRRGWGPSDRPPVGLRLFFGVLGVGAMLSTGALLLSDRAPGVLQAVFGDRARQLWERIDASARVDLPPGSELPGTDALVHIAIWAVVATLVGLTVWGWRGLVFVTVCLAAASGLLELAQGRYAETRAVEASDAVANLLGIGVGVVVVAVTYLLWSGVAGVVRRLARR